MSQYIIGIDLGTTNIAVSYLKAEEAEEAVPELFAIIQITDQGERDQRTTLPSFLYLPDDKEVSKKALDLPWATERDYSGRNEWQRVIGRDTGICTSKRGTQSWHIFVSSSN